MSVNFTPTFREYRNPHYFRFWCQKVLPLVYDDSLSYYELLCKVVKYLNDLIEDSDAVKENLNALKDAYEQLMAYVNNYFDNLDVQEEINNKLDQMAADGTITGILFGLTNNRYFNSADNEDEIMFYVSDSAGLDTNDGRTRETPVKTMKQAFQLAANIYNDVRITVLTAANYYVDMFSYAGNSVHIDAEEDITLTFKNGPFYGTHLNLNGGTHYITMRSERTDKMLYTDGGLLTANNVIFDCYLRLNGTQTLFNNCTISNVYFYGANIIFGGDNNYFKDPVRNDIPAIRLFNSFVNVYSLLHFNLSIAGNTDFFIMNGGDFIVGTGLVNDSGFIYRGNITINRAKLAMASDAATAFYAMAAGSAYLGALITDQTPVDIAIPTESKAIDNNSYTVLREIELKPGSWLIALTVTVLNGTDKVGNCRITTNTGNYFQTLEAKSGQHNFNNITFWAVSGEAQTVKVEVQYMSGITAQTSGRMIRFR